jgi:hypothetical protein
VALKSGSASASSTSHLKTVTTYLLTEKLGRCIDVVDIDKNTRSDLVTIERSLIVPQATSLVSLEVAIRCNSEPLT